MSSLSSVGYFLISNLFSMVLFVLWARFFIRYFAIGTFHPFSQTIYTLTAPVVAPIQRNITRDMGGRSRYDFACLMLIIIGELLKLTAINLLFLNSTLAFNNILIYAIVDMIVAPCNILFYAVILRAVMSWINPSLQNPLANLLFMVTEPLLRTIRKVVPTLGMVDLSPIVAMLLLKSIEIFLSGLFPTL